MSKHLLNDRAVRTAKPDVKPYRLADGDNLYLFVATTGVKSWQLRYRHDGKPQTNTLGKYDAMSLSEARAAADRARPLVDAGEHLTAVKRTTKVAVRVAAAETFEAVANSWMQKRRKKPWSAKHRAQVRASIDNHLADLKPWPISKINARLVAPMLDAIGNSAPLMLEKVRPRLDKILNHAVTLGYIERNPLPPPEPERKDDRKHYPAVTDVKSLGVILRTARAADPCKGIARAHVLLVYTALRVSEVVGAQWREFDLQAGEWHVPRERMKRKDAARGPHVVPLPPVLLATLREWHEADGTDDDTYVCAAPRDPSKPVTAEGCEKFYRDALILQGKHSPHSWRSAFSTICRDAGKDSDIVESQLDHVVGNKVAAAYDRAKRLELRRQLLKWYEATLIAARDGAAVTAIKRKA